MRGRERASGPALVLLHPGVVAALVAVTLAWAGPVTHTGGHAGEVLHDTVRSLTGQGGQEPGSSDTSYFLFGDSTSPQERMHLFVEATMDYRAAEIPPRLRVIPTPGGRAGAGGAHPAVDAGQGRVRDRDGGLLAARPAAAAPPAPARRRRRPLPREMALLVWGSMAALGLIVLVPNLSVDYGVLRAFQQTMLPSPGDGGRDGMVVRRRVLRPSCRSRSRRARRHPAADRAGRRAATTTASTSPTPRWGPDLARRGRPRRPHQRAADRQPQPQRPPARAQRQPRADLDRFYLTLLSRDAYVFVDGQILDQGESTVFYTGDLLTYRYPLRAVDRRLDLLLRRTPGEGLPMTT